VPDRHGAAFVPEATGDESRTDAFEFGKRRSSCSSDRHFSVSRERCAQCNGEPDGREQQCAIGYPDGRVVEVWLHRECEAFWLGDRKCPADDPPWIDDPALAFDTRGHTDGFIRSIETDALGRMKRKPARTASRAAVMAAVERAIARSEARNRGGSS
jgi:hypothetical protein